MASAEQLKFELLAVDRASRPIQQVQGRVRNFDRQIKQSSVQMNNFGGSVTGAQKSLRKFALGGLQQAGYQVGDYAVQVANGTSKIQAFGQQAGQFFQIFGPFGAVLGAAISVFSAFKMAADRAAGATNNVETAVTQLSAAYDTLDSIDFDGIGSDMSSSLDPVLEKYSSLIRLIREAAEERRDEALKTVVGALPPALDKGLQNQLKSLKTARQRNQRFLGQEETIYNNLLKMENDRLRVTEIVLGIRGATRQEAAESLANATALLYEEGLMTTELRDQLDLFQSQQGLSSVIASEAKDAASAHNDATSSAKQSSAEYERQDQIFRDIARTTGNNVALFNSMVAAQKKLNEDKETYLKKLSDEDILMGQIVEKAVVIGKGGVQGGRGADPRQFTFLDEYLAQIAAGRKAKDEADEAAQSGTKKTAKIIKSELSPELMRIKDASEMIGSSFENAFMSVKEGTMSVKDAFNSMANDIINELYRIFVVKQITGFITSAFTGAFNPASAAGTGGAVAPPVAPRAMGGPVSGGRPYMVGERGPELVVPSRNGHVMPNNQLGGGTVVVNQNINVATGVQQTVRAEVLGLMPQIAEASKAAVLDARRRGGAFAGSF